MNCLVGIMKKVVGNEHRKEFMYSLRHQVLMNSFGARNNENRAEWVDEVQYQLGVR